ncbi:MAG: ribosomal protein S18-alanine N-acetyltransferase [Bacillota bacterium]|nr:ribosomal protein S18-alanine N-acetyltransferase [Bacillota bacterium]
MENKILIRKVKEEDLVSLYEIEKTLEDSWSFNILRDDFLGNNFSSYFLAEKDGEILGFIALMNVAGEIHINNIAVDQNYRRQGIGQRLLTYGLNYFAKEKLIGYTLEVREDNLAAINLYEKLGFIKVGLRKNYYKNNKAALIMWKLIEENL